MQKLTHQEEAAMQIIWKKGGGVIKDILEEMPSPKPPYTTLASTIKKLEQKKYLKSKLYGNVYFYEPAISEEKYKDSILKGITESFFDNSYKSLVTFFARKEKISQEDLEEIVRLIEKKK